MSTVVVAGGGPTGLVAAILLAQRGHRVQVYEKREDPRLQDFSVAPPRTLFWGINARGQAALAQTKVHLPQTQGERLGGMTKAGSMDWIVPGTRSWSGQTSPPRAVEPQVPSAIFASRAEFVQHLAHEIQRLHPDRVQLHFQHSLQAVDWTGRQATFQDGSGADVAAPYDLLIGADGVHSKTRQLYQQHDPAFKIELQPAPKDYVGFSGIPVDGYMADELGAKQPVRDHRGLHLKVWKGNSDAWTVLFSANSRGSLTGHLSAVRPAISPVDSKEEYMRILETQIPHLPACLREPIAAAVVGGHKAPLGTSGCVSSLVGPRMALLGDAAHSLNPIMGQGVNSAMQDAAVLCQMLDESGQDIDAGLQQFQQQRHPEILALHSMDLASPAWAGQKGKLHPMKLAKQFHDFRQARRAQQRGVGVMQMPHLAAFTGLGPYSQANAAWEEDRNLFFGLAATAAAAMIGAAGRLVTVV